MDETRDIIARLDLQPHPEGGFYRETFRQRSPDGGPDTFAHIYYLLPAGQRSAWHRVDVSEIWHFHAGAPLRLSLSADGKRVNHHAVGNRIAAGEEPCVVVAPGTWMAAISLGPWTLIGCTTVPAFRFEGFELAAPGWEPDGSI